MTRSRRLMPLIAALGLAACAASSPTERSADAIAEMLTPVQLISQASILHGQRISVRGYFTSRTDTRALWENEAAWLDAKGERLGPNEDYWAKCITIYRSASDAGHVTDRLVTFTGQVTIIEKDDARSLWTCNAVALENAVITSR